MSHPRHSSLPTDNILVNTTRGRVLATTIEHAASAWDRARGLIGRATLPAGHALSLHPCSSVHTCGMSFPLDIVHLSTDGRVLRIVTNLQPWRVGPIVRHAHWTIELPAGVIAETGTRAGDIITFVPPDSLG